MKDGDRLGAKMTAAQMAESVKRATAWLEAFKKTVKQ